MIRVTVRKDSLGGIAKRAPAALAQALLGVGFGIQADWQQGVHVKTGTYRRSITTEATGTDQVTVYSPIEYSIYQEYGTRFSAGDGGAARQAAAKHERDLQAAVITAFGVE